MTTHVVSFSGKIYLEAVDMEDATQFVEHWLKDAKIIAGEYFKMSIKPYRIGRKKATQETYEGMRKRVLNTPLP